MPAQFSEGQVSYMDLALDLLVFPDGRQLILDEDEFAALAVDDATCAAARAALQDLRTLFHAPGFDIRHLK
jgi:predicted RNA-binding protein associated with RNAse of E/G family